ncbi:hypothetical protein M422DRAFT_240285 [Sphaerobolus stellatus SS14]|nr:hypothetical protein M422DRAFT_240285 [Sphaerobolus stellatus SS14]
MTAVSALHDQVMHWATPKEKEEGKRWVEETSCKEWRNGYAMVNGTLIPIAEKPGFHSEAYFDRKSNYLFNVQLITLLSLHIIDYVIGHCESAHDSTTFQDSQANKEHSTLFGDAEWLWADSAYVTKAWCVMPFKQPAADLPENHLFNYWVSQVHIWSEHAVRFVKG